MKTHTGLKPVEKFRRGLEEQNAQIDELNAPFYEAVERGELSFDEENLKDVINSPIPTHTFRPVFRHGKGAEVTITEASQKACVEALLK